jgi:hypothetical protein
MQLADNAKLLSTFQVSALLVGFKSAVIKRLGYMPQNLMPNLDYRFGKLQIHSLMTAKKELAAKCGLVVRISGPCLADKGCQADLKSMLRSDKVRNNSRSS